MDGRIEGLSWWLGLGRSPPEADILFGAPFSCLLCVLVCSTGLHRNWLFGFTIHVPEALAEYVHSLARPSMRVSAQGVEGLIQSTAEERYADVCNILLFIAH